MQSDVRWYTVTVLGHELEKKLQELTNDGYEIVSIEKTASKWLIIAHQTRKNRPSKNPIGFQAV
jgi:phage repressor protein C with HTH and peptisase S24 domain